MIVWYDLATSKLNQGLHSSFMHSVSIFRNCWFFMASIVCLLSLSHVSALPLGFIRQWTRFLHMSQPNQELDYLANEEFYFGTKSEDRGSSQDNINLDSKSRTKCGNCLNMSRTELDLQELAYDEYYHNSDRKLKNNI